MILCHTARHASWGRSVVAVAAGELGVDAQNASESHGRWPACGFMLLILTIMVCSVIFRIISRHRVEAMQHANAWGMHGSDVPKPQACMAQRAGAGAAGSMQAACRRSSSPEPVASGAAMSRAVRYWLLTEPLRETWEAWREGGRQPLHIRLLSAGSRPNSGRGGSGSKPTYETLCSLHTCCTAGRRCGRLSAGNGGRPQWARQLAAYNATETQQKHGCLASPCRRAGPQQ